MIRAAGYHWYFAATRTSSYWAALASHDMSCCMPRCWMALNESLCALRAPHGPCQGMRARFEQTQTNSVTCRFSLSMHVVMLSPTHHDSSVKPAVHLYVYRALPMAPRKAPPSAWSNVQPVPVFSFGLKGNTCALPV